MLTREQRYAAKTYEQIANEIQPRPPEEQKKYGSMAHKLPVLIRAAGLAQALQFVESRGDKQQKLLLQHLAVALDFKDDDDDEMPTAKLKLLKSIRTAELSTYMRLTQQALAALQWYKRFAQSVLNVEAAEQ